MADLHIGITGARGVVGRRLVEECRAEGIGISLFDGDIRDAESVGSWLRDFTHIIHCAAIVPVARVAEDPATAIDTNVTGTAVVVRTAQKIGAHVTYMSTSHIYGAGASPKRETDAPNPISAYGLSKLQGEQWVQRLTDNFLILRIFSYFDSRQKPPYLVPSLAKRILAAPANSKLTVTNSESIRDFATVQWLAPTCMALVRNSDRGIINCGTGRGTSVLKIAEAVKAAFGRSDVALSGDGNGNEDVLIADTTVLSQRTRVQPPLELAHWLRSFAGSFDPAG